MSSCTLSSLAVTYGYLPPKVMVLKTMLLTVARVKTYEPIYMILITLLRRYQSYDELINWLIQNVNDLSLKPALLSIAEQTGQLVAR